MFSAHKVRLNRFLAADGRCLDVAIDHGVFNEHAFLDGLEDMPAVVRALGAAGPDAIQMNIGQADVLQSIPGPRKPALVLRTDVGNLYNATTHKVMFNQLVHWDEPIVGALNEHEFVVDTEFLQHHVRSSRGCTGDAVESNHAA